MSRFHIHISVDDMDSNVQFYSAVFGTRPTVHKSDYAKWALEDPKLNFAISTHAANIGVDHVGLQAENNEELEAIRARLEAAGIPGLAEEGTTCCYAQSDKYWVQDPQGLAWESFHSLASAPVYGKRLDQEDAGASCCTPAFDNRCC
jgi:catechol 2,3-dioxygenase-like lactoylglutathione lyase family enzyme